MVPQEGEGAAQDSYLQVVERGLRQGQGKGPGWWIHKWPMKWSLYLLSSLSSFQEPSPEWVLTCSAFDRSCLCPGWQRAFCCLSKGGELPTHGFLDS